MKQNTQHLKRGFTLVEIILYIATSSLLIASFAGLLILQFATTSKTQATLEVEEQAQQVLNILVEEIKQSDEINSPTTGNTSNTLVLESLHDNPQTTTISASGGDLTINDGSNTYSLLSNKVRVDNFSVYNITPQNGHGTVRITITLGFDTNSASASWQYSNTYYLTVNTQ